MVATVTRSSTQVDVLRGQNYNARVIDVQDCHDDLMILRVRPDRGVPPFSAGQYTVLGLGNWESRVAGVQPELGTAQPAKLIKRAYSISSALLTSDGQLVPAEHCSFLEFYITLVRQADKRPPALTPRLFALQRGDRLFCGPHAHGHYTLQRIRRDHNLVFAATGTGEAPHNAMLSELLASGHRGRIACVTCVRWRKDLGYADIHRRLEERFSNYRYLPLTTREVENLDPASPGYVGRRYLQDYLASSEFERDAGFDLDPQRAHVFVCGSPEMIGVPHHTSDPAKRYPQPKGMIEVLEQRGFAIDLPHEPGSIHFEKYW